MSKLKPYGNYAATQPTSFDRLPTDSAFVAKIIGAKIDENQYGQSLIFQVEITEGDYAGFFKKDYDSRQGGQYEAKYKGVYRLNLPSNDGSERDSWTVNRCNRTFGAIEASNAGYKWDWDTASLKNKAVGFVTRTAEYNGNEFTEIGMLIDVENARKGSFRPMKKRGQTVPSASPVPEVAPVASAWDSDDDSLPF